jgi:biopolymer transport protein TolQ
MNSSLLDVVSHSGPLAQAVLVVLFGSSVAVWALVYFKWRELTLSRKAGADFVQLFDSTAKLEDVESQAQEHPYASHRRVFETSYRTYVNFISSHRKLDLTLPESHVVRGELYQVLSRNMEAAVGREESRLSHGQTALATISVAAPFVGLFGTVVGIIEAFHAIASLKSVDLSVVAPGISEALVATAAGLFTALPSTVAFNVFRNQINQVVESLDEFSLHMLNRIQMRNMVPNEPGD